MAMAQKSLSPELLVELILDNCPSGIIGLDKSGTVAIFNRAAEEMTGYAGAEVVGKFILNDLLGSAGKALELVQMIEGLGFGGSGRAMGLETTITTRAGEVLPVVFSAVMVQQQGLDLGSLGFFDKAGTYASGSDALDALNKTQRALRECEERYQALLVSSPDAVILYDGVGNVTYVNPSFTQMFGWGIDEISGRKLDFVPEESKEETGKAVARMLAGEKIVSFQTKRLTEEGRKLDVQLSASMIYGQDGKVLGTVVIQRDITDQIRAERERAQQERLQGVLEMAVAAAHEMSQPLQVIVGDASFLLNEIKSDTELREVVEGIHAAAKRLGEVAYKIQRISRYETVIYVGDSRMIDLDKASK